MDLGRFFKPQKQDSDHTHKETPPNKPCAVPMLNQVMSATSGATDVFSRHVNSSLRKLGAKNIEAGIGGVGLPVKPGLLHQVQYFLVVTTAKMMMKFGIAPNLPFGQGALPASFQSGIDMANTASKQLSPGRIMQLATKPDQVLQGLLGSQPEQVGSASENTALKGDVVDSTSGSRTEKVLSSFLRNPFSKGKPRRLDEADERMRLENKILQMVLKHQEIIEELVEENEKLRHILVEDLKVSSSKLQANSSGKSKLACTDCPECGRTQKKSR